MSSKHYDIKTLQDYLAGKLDAKTMHALERQALEDPALSDALAGLMANPGLTTKDIDLAVDRLNARLDKRIQSVLGNNASSASDQSNDFNNATTARAVVDPQSGNNQTGQIPEAAFYQKTEKTSSITGRTWWRVAAVLVVLLAGAWFYFGMQGKQERPDFSADKQFALNDADTAAANQSLPGASQKGIASAINKVLTDSVAAINNGKSIPAGIAKADKTRQGNKADGQIQPPDPHKIAMGKNAVKAQEGLHPSISNPGVSGMAKREPRMNREMLTAAITVVENKASTGMLADTTAGTNGQATILAPKGLALDDLLSPEANTRPMPGDQAGDSNLKLRGIEAPGKRFSSDSVNSLNEVVVVGYGKQRKKSLTGAAERSVNRKVKRMTNKGIMVKGLQLDSITPDYQTQPLFIVDGKPLKAGKSYSLKPKDIDKVNIIKAKDAVPVYGKDARYGAILITTKKAAGKDAANMTAIAGEALPTKKLNGSQIRNVPGLLSGKVPGLVPLDASTNLGLRKVRVTRLNGDLAPVNGFESLKKYLEKKLIKGIIAQGIVHIDTAHIYFQVHLENTSKGKRTKVTHIRATDKAVADWFRFAAQKTAGWPDWQVEKSKNNRDIEDAQDSAKMEITLFK